MTKIIKNREEHARAISDLENLMVADPAPGTPDFERMELLSLLVENFENQISAKSLPTPLEAIEFRMEHGSLTRKDLEPIIGSRSKVSEILSGKRSLTLSMIKALHSRLGIPADVLLQSLDDSTEIDDLDWQRFPIRDMMKRGWITSATHKNLETKESLFEAIQEFLKPVRGTHSLLTFTRQSEHVRSSREMDRYALTAWAVRVVSQAMKALPSREFIPGTIDLKFMQSLAHLSTFADGPLQAIEFLREHGICVVVEPHLSRTHLDGAAIKFMHKWPIIGLTIRHDRLDNFWFTLMHELAHISLHFDSSWTVFYDDMEVEEVGDVVEVEANELAGEALIPEESWHSSPASKLRSPVAAQSLAKKLNIHPAIVAGRMRHEFKAYRLLTNLVGLREVRKYFPGIKWE